MNSVRAVQVLVLLVLAAESLCQIPNVYEFCSALLSDQRSSHNCTCSSNVSCHSRPGKRGPAGVIGPRGEKGDRGEQGMCEGLEDRQAAFEAKILERLDLIPKIVYCSLGMKNGEIPDEAITASSHVSYRFSPFYGRLDQKIHWKSADSDDSTGAWCPPDQPGQWIQVDLGSRTSIAGVITQGRPTNPWTKEWTKTFKVSCGDREDAMQFIMKNGMNEIFTGNFDANTKVVNKFPLVVHCRFVRLHPLIWNRQTDPFDRPCIRMEILRGECHGLY